MKLLRYIWAKLTGKTKFADDVARMAYWSKRLKLLFVKHNIDVNVALATVLIVACELVEDQKGDRKVLLEHARMTWDNVIRPRQEQRQAIRAQAAADSNRHGRRRERKLKALEGGKK